MTVRAVTTMDDTKDAAEIDRRLLAAVASGDRAAFRRLHARYHQPVYRFALRLIRRADWADEVSSDTLMAVWRSAAQFRGEAKPSSWIFGIAYRIALKAGRRLSREALHQDIDAESPELPCEPGPRAEVIVLRQSLTEALATLPIEQRATVVLTYRYGYRLSEIAEITGCPVGTVKTRMFHARAKLRHILRGEL